MTNLEKQIAEVTKMINMLQNLQKQLIDQRFEELKTSQQSQNQ